MTKTASSDKIASQGAKRRAAVLFDNPTRKSTEPTVIRMISGTSKDNKVIALGSGFRVQGLGWGGSQWRGGSAFQINHSRLRLAQANRADRSEDRGQHAVGQNAQQHDRQGNGNENGHFAR